MRGKTLTLTLVVLQWNDYDVIEVDFETVYKSCIFID